MYKRQRLKESLKTASRKNRVISPKIKNKILTAGERQIKKGMILKKKEKSKRLRTGVLKIILIKKNSIYPTKNV